LRVASPKIYPCHSSRHVLDRKFCKNTTQCGYEWFCGEETSLRKLKQFFP
jgi:hypothetical protein